MSRRKIKKKHDISSDYYYNSKLVSKFINCLMYDGKKNLSTKIVYTVLNKFNKSNNLYSIELLQKAVNNVKPILEVKSRKIGGSNYQVPIEINDQRSISLAIKWIIQAARKRSEKGIINQLYFELLDAYCNKGNAIKKKKSIYSIAESNKAFSHFKW